MKKIYTQDTTFLENQLIKVYGWVNSYRDHGGVLFIDLRDKTGIVQVVCSEEFLKENAFLNQVRNEWVLEVKGLVRKRAVGMENTKISTGTVEIVAEFVKVINESETPPFEINAHAQQVNEETKLKYRYLDLRRPEMQNIFKLKNTVLKSVRSVLETEDFMEFDTPILTKTTPEGARDYLVPSRVHPGEFYGLPQSPQLFKQLLMCSGFDKYYQIAKCFRDEDLRADRQPEFQQIDVEMAFVEQEHEVMDVMQRLMNEILHKTDNFHRVIEPKSDKVFRDSETDYFKITWEDAMECYGSDKPDLRFELPFIEMTESFILSDFEVFKNIANTDGERIKAMVVPNGCELLSRNALKENEEFVKKFGAKGLAYFKYQEGTLSGPLAKFMGEDELNEIIEQTGAQENDLIYFAAGKSETILDYFGRLRLKLGKDLNLYNDSDLCFVFVVDFPMFESA